MTHAADVPDRAADVLADPVRQAAVRRLLEARVGSAGLDRLTRLAAELLDAPRAQVSLLAEEQVVASSVGDVGPERGPAEDSLCSVTVRSGGPLVVEDAPSDGRVAHLPPVQQGSVGAYLGVPLTTGEGLLLGALCVHDSKPRGWSDRERALLAELAAGAVSELELRALSEEAATKAAQLELVLSAADTGSFDLDLATGDLHWDDRLVSLFAYDRATFGGRLDDFTARVHPDDRERVAEAIDRAVGTVGDLSVEYRIVRPDGTRWIEARGRVLPGRDGRPARLLGVAYDSTELRDARDRLARLLETMSDAFYSLDRQWRFTFVNPEAEKLLGRRADELLGTVLWDEFPETAGTVFEQEYTRARDTGEPASFETYYAPLQGWFELRAWPTPDGIAVYFREVSARKRAEQERAQAVVERERAYAAAEAANHRLSLLADASHRLAQSLEPAQVLQRLSEVVLPQLGDWVVVALAGEQAAPLLERGVPEDDDGVHVVHVAHSRPDQLAALDGLVRSLPLSTADPAGVGAVVRTGEPEWLPTVPDEVLVAFAQDEQTLQAVRELGVAAALTVPLVSRGRVLGAVTVAEPASGPVDRALLVDLAARAAVALDNALLYGQERRTGLTLQRSLLPGELPRLPGIEVAVRYRPGATGAFVGGDWYQGVVVDDRLLLCMGDVMGHGMRSAARMGQLRAVVATLALEGHGPGELLGRLSRNSDALLDLDLATVLVATYSPAQRRLVVASAGHPPPLLAPLTGPPAYVDVVPGPPIGSFPGDYDEVAVDVPPGSTFVLYTDGLVEQRGAALDVGLERLRSALSDLRLPPEQVADHVLRELGREQGAADDVALLVFSDVSGSGG